MPPEDRHRPEPFERAIGPAREAFRRFLGAAERTDRFVVLCDFDADGLASGALLTRALGRRAFTDVVTRTARRHDIPFSTPTRRRIAALKPRRLAVLDLGVRAEGLMRRVPTLYVDHHQPDGAPPAAVVVSGYGWEPEPCTAWLMFELLRPLGAVNDLAWIAAIGVIGDLGDRAPWPELPAVKRRYTAKVLREAVSLVNAARRASAFDVETPLRMLLEVDEPAAIATDVERGADRLRAYRAEVRAELERARHRPPVMSRTGPWALIELRSRCQVHPLIAQLWTGRLRDRAVIAANTGYLPGVVAFSVRTARRDLDLPAMLRSIDVGGYRDRYGYGHDRASGGRLPPHAFNRLVDALGFDARVRVTRP